MHIHILGISGTFMSALALLARDAGYTVSGSDAFCYPPISTLLEENDIEWVEGYEECERALAADVVIVGNAIKRGLPVLEAILNQGKNYLSGPQWLAENILYKYRVIAVAGTHGKTTTTSMLAWIFSEAGLNPSFLVGGVPSNFKTSTLLGTGEWFIIEADEYDSAFFDKRPKFMHYRPEVALLNNLEFDHADIYADLAAIQQQFHYYLRTIPNKATIVAPKYDVNLAQVLSRGVHSSVKTTALNAQADWQAELLDTRGSQFLVYYRGIKVAEVAWSLLGIFNVENALMSIAAAFEAGIDPQIAAEALAEYIPVKRRLEVKYAKNGITVYDDFAHHPTAIKKTIQAVKLCDCHRRIVVVLECASHTMRSGVHAHLLADALAGADCVYILKPDFSLNEVCERLSIPCEILNTTDKIVDAVFANTQAGDAILIMSNRAFDNIHQKIITKFSGADEVPFTI